MFSYYYLLKFSDKKKNANYAFKKSLGRPNCLFCFIYSKLLMERLDCFISDIVCTLYYAYVIITMIMKWI